MKPPSDSAAAPDYVGPTSRLKRMLAAFAGGYDGFSVSSLDMPPSLPYGDERWVGFGWAVVACLLATALALALRSALDPANLVLLYLMAVVLVAARFGRKPGIVASFFAVLAFDLFLVPPYYSLTVADTQYLLTFAIMLTVALMISNLTANLRHQARIAHYRERRTSALFDLSKELSAALTGSQIGAIGKRHLEAMFQAEVTLLLPDRRGMLQPSADEASGAAPRISPACAQQAYDRQMPVGLDGGRMADERVLYLPLRAPMRTRGVLAVAPRDARQFLLPEQQRLLHTCSVQIALAVERVHYADVAQEALIAMESERLRNSLLSAISHDVRTPLTAIVGLSSTLASSRPLPPETRHDLAQAIQEEALRMSNLVTNLLDMARLQAGGVKLNRQWQMLEEVVGSALALLSRPLEERRIEVALAPALPLLDFDAVLIERVFCNLLDNAAKYTPAGSPLRIAAEPRSGEVWVAVEDAGPGVPGGMEEAIFMKFRRGGSESARSGAGLGLSICRAIVEAHGGRIWVENRRAGGARFIFSLPVGSPPDDAALPENAEPLKMDGGR